jgi:hypothetical protein
MSFLTDRLRTQLDCRQLAEHYGVRFRKRSSGWWLAHCFNAESHKRGDRNPSLSISAHGYKCFSANCAISGDIFSLIAHFEDLPLRESFEEILKIASHKAGLDHQALLTEERAHTKPKLTYQNPAQWRRDKKRQQKARARQQIDSLKQGSTGSKTSVEDLLRTPHKPDIARADLRLDIYNFMVRTLDPHTPPPLNDHFPDPFDDPFSIDPRHPRLEIMQRIWQLTAPLDLTKAACTWLKSRGIDPRIAHAYGCRDWSPVSTQLTAALSDFSPQQLEQAGLVRHQEGQRKTWTGLRAVKGDEWAQGLGVPIVHPGWPMAPIAWRWRLFHPFKTRDGKTFKAIAQYSGEPRVPSIPLGSTPLTAHALGGFARWPALSASPEEPRYAVVICEGEPDWLSMAEVSAQIDSDLYLVPVGLIAMSHGYPPSMSGLLEQAEAIVCIMDRGNTNKKWAKNGGQVVVDQIRGTLMFRGMQRGDDFNACFARIDRMILTALQEDDNDVNDLHKNGKLLPLIVKTFGDRL